VWGGVVGGGGGGGWGGGWGGVEYVCETSSFSMDSNVLFLNERMCMFWDLCCNKGIYIMSL